MAQLPLLLLVLLVLLLAASGVGRVLSFVLAEAMRGKQMGWLHPR